MNNISNSSNTNQAIWVGLGKLSTILLSIISAAILARYFDKKDYGTYKQVIYIYNTLLILFSAGLDGCFSYFLPKQTMEQGKDFVYRQIKILILLGFGFSAFLFFLSPIIANLFNNPDLKKGLKLFSIVPILMLPTIGIEGIYASIRKTHIIAIYTSITRVLMLATITLPVIFLKGTYMTALYGWIIASFMIAVISIYLILRPFKEFTRCQSKFRVKDIFNYSLPLMVATIYGILIRFADQFFISRYYGAEVFAEFSNGFIDLPFVSLVSGAAVTVLLPVFSKYSETAGGLENICKTWKNLTEKTVILVYPVLVFFIFNAKSSVIALYGEQYAISAGYFIIGMTIGFFNIIVFQTVLFALGKTRLYSRIHLVQAVMIWFAGYLVVNFSGSSFIYALISRLFYIGQVCVGIIYAIKLIGVKARDIIPFKTMLKTLFHSSLICSLTAWLVGLFDLNVFFRLGLSGLISAGIILSTASFFGIQYWATFRSMLYDLPGFSHFRK